MNYEAEKVELKKLFDYYLIYANKRVSWAQTWIADAYFWGWGVDKNYQKFIEWDTKAARNGSSVSKRRMILYHLSLGHIDAAVSACQIRDDGFTISTYGNDYPQEIKFKRFYDNFISKFNGYICSHKEQLINKRIDQIIDEYEISHEHDLKNDPSSSYGLGEADLSRAICLIFGFGFKQDLALAMQTLTKIYDSLKDTNERQIYYYSSFDAWHYACCLREGGIPGSDSFWEVVSTLAYNGKCLLCAYYYRHAIRKAFEGNIEAAITVGKDMLEEKGNLENEYRLFIYHDNRCALSYLKMAAGVVPNSFATMDVIKLTSNPKANTFDWTYAYNLCLKVETALPNIPEPDDNEYGLRKKWVVESYLKNAYINLSQSTSDGTISKTLADKARQLEKNE